MGKHTPLFTFYEIPDDAYSAIRSQSRKKSSYPGKKTENKAYIKECLERLKNLKKLPPEMSDTYVRDTLDNEFGEGSIRAGLKFGIAFLYGIGVDKDIKRGIECIEEAAELGDFTAMLQLAHMHRIMMAENQGPVDGLVRAYKIYRYIIDSPRVEEDPLAKSQALFKLGQMFYNYEVKLVDDSSIIPESAETLESLRKKGLDYIKLAAQNPENDDARAFLERERPVSETYNQNILDLEQIDILLDITRGSHSSYIKARDFFDRTCRKDEFVKYAMRAHSQGMEDASFEFAQMIFEGRYFPHNYDITAVMFGDMGMRGYRDADYYIALHLKHGYAFEKNTQSAANVLEKYVENTKDKGHDRRVLLKALLLLGHMYYKGDGVTRDEKKAQDYFMQAAAIQENSFLDYHCHNDEALAASSLFEWCMDFLNEAGINSVKEDEDGDSQESVNELMFAAEQLMEYAVQAGNADAIAWRGLTLFYLEKYDLSRSFLERAAALGSGLGMFGLAQMYLSASGVKRDEKLGLKLLEDAEKTKNPLACYFLAQMYEHGIGVKINCKKAVSLYKITAASHQGRSIKAAIAIGSIYFSGGQGIDKDPSKAFYWYKKASDMGSIEGKRCFGMCYYMGVGAEKDYDRALELFRTAADADDEKAIYMIALMYEKGRGVEASTEKAMEYYDKAANLGLRIAKKKYDALKRRKDAEKLQ